jgi:DNA-binding phage protein
VFMLALRDGAEAHKISRVAVAAGLNRETLRTRSARGNPTFTTLKSILAAGGVRAPLSRARNANLPLWPAASASARLGFTLKL